MYNDNIPNISWPLRQYNFFQSFFMSAKTSSYISFLGKGAVRCWNMDENWPTNIIGSGNSTILHPVSVAIYILSDGSSLRLGQGSARALHLDRLPWARVLQAQASGSGSARARDLEAQPIPIHTSWPAPPPPCHPPPLIGISLGYILQKSIQIFCSIDFEMLWEKRCLYFWKIGYTILFYCWVFWGIV